MATPESWENATPVFGIRYPKPTAPAQKLPDAFTHIGVDLESALVADQATPPGLNYRTGTNAERLAATPTKDLIWVVTDVAGNPKYIGTGTAWVALASAGNIGLGTRIVTSPDQSVTATWVGIGTALTVTPPRDGTLRFLATFVTYSTAVTDVAGFRIVDTGTLAEVGSLSRQANAVQSVGTTLATSHTMFLTGVTAGPHTYQMQGVRAAGTGTVTFHPTAVAPHSMQVDLLSS